MIVKLKINSKKNKFFIDLISNLKDVVEEMSIVEDKELLKENEKKFNEMSNEERWEKFGEWSDEDLKECIMESNRYILKKMDEEYGEEDYKAWQK